MFRTIVVLCFLNVSETAARLNHLRIIGGHDVAEGEFPFVVLLISTKRRTLIQFCTASAISQRWVLTAGHCLNTRKAEDLFVWHTNFTIPPKNNSLLTKVLEIVVHPRYVHRRDVMLTLYNDLCLLLVEELRMARYGRLLAVDHMTLIGIQVTYVGGGRLNFTSDPKRDAYKPMQIGQGAITTCDKRMASYQMLTVCVTPKKPQRPYRGDSGGPLMFEDKIIGVCSHGRRPRVAPMSVFAAISPQIDWIENVIKIYG